MNAIPILAEDLITYKNFAQGSPVQLRVCVSNVDGNTFEKGTLINVIHKNKEVSAKIVSDPIVISQNTDQGEMQELSLVVEKV